MTGTEKDQTDFSNKRIMTDCGTRRPFSSGHSMYSRMHSHGHTGRLREGMRTRKMPKIKNSFKELYKKLLTNQETNIFIAAIKLGIFRELSYWKSSEELAEKHNFDPENTAVIMNSLASLDLIEKKKGLFRNLPAAEEFLASNDDTYLGEFFLSSFRWYNLSSDDICSLVKYGPDKCMHKNKTESEGIWAEQAELSVNYQRAGMVQLASRIVSSLPEFGSFRKMLDLGCGPGLFGISIAMGHPSMNAVLFDRPAVSKVAERLIGEYGMEDRVKAVGGDYINDPLGKNYDLVWASMTLNFAGDSLNDVIKKVCDSLNPGGVFVSFSDGKTNGGTKPKEMVLGTLMPALYGNDMGLNEGVIAGAMLKEGFKSVHSRAVMTPVGEVMVDTARKEV
ncbi:SAM-dependent methyltransferase [Methanomicrobium sp. W14]|uniref:class I SAM-dependent methyltransferase n=1 Tax=Methanomicrobium sp. W14 TaxID=2817839 RepID=UPI001AE99ACE|nr:class I SAM-dependent methyltransferase [Methanomicrobium sp. W14]MBP2132495.1 SAM-dependent methyltransferase [Methanomicrobium sp. W14]